MSDHDLPLGGTATPARSGTTPTSCRTSRSSAGCSVGIVDPSRRRRRAPACATSSPSPTSTTASRPSTATPMISHVQAQPGAAGAGAGGEHRQRTAERAWPSVAVRACARSTASTSTSPPRSTDTDGRRPRRGPGRPRGDGCRTTARRSGSGCSARSGLVIGPRGQRGRPGRRSPRAELDLLDYGSAADAGLRRQPTRTARSSTPSDGGPASSTAVRACGGASTASSTRTCRWRWCVRVTSSGCTISNHSGEAHPMHLHGHHAVVLVARRQVKATGSPWWFDSLEVRNGRDLRRRVRRRQPRHLDGPLPQPQARRRGDGHAPDVRRRDDAVPARRRTPATSRSEAPRPVATG